MIITLPFDIRNPAPTTWLVIAVGMATGVVALLLLHYWQKHLAAQRQRAAILRELPPVQDEGLDDEDAASELGRRAMERRSSLRRKGNRVKVYVCLGDDLNTMFEGWVIDRSVGGLALSVPKQIGEGGILSLRTPDAPQTVAWVQVEVKNCRARGRQWEIGCQFLMPLPWNVLLLFG
jgi:uncharacterized protein YbjT (DUF2867 family)